MRTITKLQIKRAIILEDARRIQRGEEPINNIRRLAVELSNKYPKKYVEDNLAYWLYHAHSKGIKLKCRTYIMDEIIKDLCDLLNMNQDELITEIER